MLLVSRVSTGADASEVYRCLAVKYWLLLHQEALTSPTSSLANVQVGASKLLH